MIRSLAPGLGLLPMFLASCAPDARDRAMPAPSKDWKSDAYVVRIGRDSGPDHVVHDDGRYMKLADDSPIESVLHDLMDCGIQRFEVNHYRHMHGGELQLIVPNDAHFALARSCFRMALPPGIRIERYDPRQDSLGERIVAETEYADEKVRAYRKGNGLAEDAPIDLGNGVDEGGSPAGRARD